MNGTLRFTILFIVVAPVLPFADLAASAQNAPLVGNTANGKIAYMKAACYSCHGTMGQGGAAPRLAPMKLSNQTFVNIVRKGKKQEDESVYWDGMPAYSARFLADSELADVYTYLASIPPPPPAKDIQLLKN